MPTILVVEDDDQNRDMIARRLEFEGYKIVKAEDGARAVGLARSEIPDLILMDMRLPVMDGWQATRRIKTADETRDIPIIALTAYAFSEDRSKSLEAGCDDYEAKPIDFARLLNKIRTYLNQ